MSGVLAAVTLFVEYRLESLRQMVLEAAQSHIGAGLDADSIAAAGIRGIRIDDLQLDFSPEQGPITSIRVPTTYIYIDIIGLLYGELNIDRIELDHARLSVRRVPGNAWYNPQDPAFFASKGGQLLSMGAFRVLGKQCTLQIDNVVRDTALSINELDFDVYRVPHSKHILATASGLLNGQEHSRFDGSLIYTSPRDFDLKIESSRLTTADVNVFLPASKRLVQTGAAQPKVRIVAYPDMTLMVWLETTFENLTIRDHPPFLRPATGTLEVLASYNTVSRELTLNSASAKSPQIGVGKLSGQISLEKELPQFDLHIESSRLPLAEILDLAVTGNLQDHGKLDVRLAEPYQVSLDLTGTIEEPHIAASANAAGGTLAFVSEDDRFPRAEIVLDDVEGAWDSREKIARAALTVADGKVSLDKHGVDIQNITGLVRLEDRALQIQPLSFVFQGNALVGRVSYNFADKMGSASLNGTLANLEETPLADAIHDTALSGTATLKASANVRPEHSTAEFSVELTQAQVDYKWFFSKPAGLGATLHGKAGITPGEKVTLNGQIRMAETVVDADMYLTKPGAKWSLQHALLSADKADIGTIAKCLQLPYEFRGSTLQTASYDWTRDNVEPTEWHATLQCEVEELHMLPTGIETPHVMKDTSVRLALTRGGNPSTGELWLHAADASTPPFGVKWFNPVKCPPELIDRFPPVPRDWTFHMQADHLVAPPWEGTAFSGEAHFTETEVGLREFQATVGKQGSVKGQYTLSRAENAYETTFVWESIPASPLLKHLKFPDILEGTANGNVTYSLDRDDPHTFTGQGRFDISEGRFNADFLLALFEGKLQESASMLPPSLEFDRLGATVSFENDEVTTEDIQLLAKGIKITGEGSYITGGEMDYDIKLAIAPDTAERIPVLRDNFTLQGYRLANRDLELEFHINGPTLRPKSELASLPSPSITLVSGALETTSEVVQVLDLPRKILLDVFKIGAGIVGGRKPPENEQK